MDANVKNEVKELIKKLGLDCTVVEFGEGANWFETLSQQILSEDFIREYSDKVDWSEISCYQILSEDFIREYSDKVDWWVISRRQTLSESFIRKYSDKIDWCGISFQQTLSESFIRKYSDKVDWWAISRHQTLSENFIREYSDKVYWSGISRHQTLSEGFMRDYSNEVNWLEISCYQMLSEGFIKEFNLKVPKTCWLYKSAQEKLDEVRKTGSYEIVGSTVIAYKSVRSNFHSVYQPGFGPYEAGQEYISHCDCNIDEENSFGLSAWTKDKALKYHKTGRLLKVAIEAGDIGAVVHDGNKIRAKKIKVLEVI